MKAKRTGQQYIKRVNPKIGEAARFVERVLARGPVTPAVWVEALARSTVERGMVAAYIRRERIGRIIVDGEVLIGREPSIDEKLTRL